MGKPNPRTKNGHARRKLRARLSAEGRACHLCGRVIDYSLPAGDPMSFEVDELVPVSRGGDPLDYMNVDAAHRICNQRRGNRMPGDARSRRLQITRSRAW
ncbi:HNH endonuclease [Gordonibacter sp.]|uniref:HNH endonuclease n=1 Tax=Gordonibacter sp. TaxID=1968902 RepID=UPI003FA5786B